MDAQRSRRTRDEARRAWYAYHRQVRFARWFGFIEIDSAGKHVWRGRSNSNEAGPQSSLLIPTTVSEWNKPALQLAPGATSGP
jgi:hypothetical protein